MVTFIKFQCFFIFHVTFYYSGVIYATVYNLPVNSKSTTGNESETLKKGLHTIVNELTTFWINATYKAEDAGLNLTTMCLPYKEYWGKSWKKNVENIHHNASESNLTVSLINSTVTFDNDTVVDLSEPEPILYIQNFTVAEKFGMNVSNYQHYETLAINFGQVCQMYPRILWINESTQARDYHFNTTVICIPFRNDEHDLNSTGLEDLLNITTASSNQSLAHVVKTHSVKHTTKKPPKKREIHDHKHSDHLQEELRDNQTNHTEVKDLELNLTSLEPILHVLTAEGALKVNLNPNLFEKHESINIYLPGACAPLPTGDEDLVETFNASQYGVNTGENIGINIEKLKELGNITELTEKLSNDTEVKTINGNNETEYGIKGGSYILPFLQAQQYDANTHPTAFKRNLSTDVNFGISVESLSNFQTDSMDYEMDLYLIMSWRDARLTHNVSSPILVKEEEIRDKIWRPDPYFANAKEAAFQEVTFDNFLMKIFPTGKVLYEIRIKLKPSCNLVLCKFPHDHQKCSVIIRSFAYPIEVVTFHWFENENEAIHLNSEISLPELYIKNTSSELCEGSRLTGNFSCLRAAFYMKRNIGFHVSQTYVPTTLALMFSWVGVWLPEELNEPRIGIAITILLTLATASAGTSEHLPNVSYTKAIDIWFLVMTAFVFFTLMQTLFVIGFARKAKTLRKYANRKSLDEEESIKFKVLAERYHKACIYFDTICRLAYPLAFLIFLMIYFFVLTQGPQDSCIINQDLR